MIVDLLYNYKFILLPWFKNKTKQKKNIKNDHGEGYLLKFKLCQNEEGKVVSEFQKLPFYWEFSTQQSKVYRGWTEREKSVSRSSLGKDCADACRGQWRIIQFEAVWPKATVTLTSWL